MSAWTKLAAKIDARSTQERITLFVVLLVVLYGAADLFLFTPQMRELKRTELKMADYRRRITFSESLLSQSMVRTDPAALARERLAAAQKGLEARSKAVDGLAGRLIPPQQMAKVLAGLSQQQPGLKLVSLKTLEAEVVGAPATVQLGSLYRHGVELVLEGSYAAFAVYLEQVERMPYRVYWGGLELDATAYPNLTLKFTVYTLSQDKTWLAI